MLQLLISSQTIKRQSHNAQLQQHCCTRSSCSNCDGGRFTGVKGPHYGVKWPPLVVKSVMCWC